MPNHSENELLIILRTVKSRKESLKMAKIRFEGGLTTETVYQQAMVEYSSAPSLVPDLKKTADVTGDESALPTNTHSAPLPLMDIPKRRSTCRLTAVTK